MAGAAYGGASLGWTAFYSGVFGGATSGLQEATMQRYRGQDFDPQPVAQSWLLGTFGAALGAAAGPALAAALSRVNYGSRETYLLVQSFWNVNRGSLGGPLGGAKSLAAQSSAAGRELTKAAGDLAGDVTGKAYENLAPGGGGDSPPPPNGAPKINDNPALGGGQHQGQTPRQQRQIDDFRKNYLHK